MSKPALGRGLSALLGGKPSGAAAPARGPAGGPVASPPGAASEAAAPDAARDAREAAGTGTGGTAPPAPAGPGVAVGSVRRVPVGMLRASALQPRHDFPPGSLQELADSIREQGILQPLVARTREGFLELIAGERRWRAAQLAGLAEVPVIVREADDPTALELMLVENLQREDLNPMDEAQGYAELMARFTLTQEAVATRVGRSRAAVANALRLLRLPAKVQTSLREGRLSTGHAKVILGISAPDRQLEASDRILAEGLSVRQTEEMVARMNAPAPAAASPAAAPDRAPAVALRDPHVVAMEDRLRQRLGTKVALRYKQGRGQIDIRFFSDEELERVLELVGVSPE